MVWIGISHQTSPNGTKWATAGTQKLGPNPPQDVFLLSIDELSTTKAHKVYPLHQRRGRDALFW